MASSSSRMKDLSRLFNPDSFNWDDHLLTLNCKLWKGSFWVGGEPDLIIDLTISNLLHAGIKNPYRVIYHNLLFYKTINIQSITSTLSSKIDYNFLKSTKNKLYRCDLHYLLALEGIKLPLIPYKNRFSESFTKVKSKTDPDCLKALKDFGLKVSSTILTFDEIFDSAKKFVTEKSLEILEEIKNSESNDERAPEGELEKHEAEGAKEAFSSPFSISKRIDSLFPLCIKKVVHSKIDYVKEQLNKEILEINKIDESKSQIKKKLKNPMKDLETLNLGIPYEVSKIISKRIPPDFNSSETHIDERLEEESFKGIPKFKSDFLSMRGKESKPLHISKENRVKIILSNSLEILENQKRVGKLIERQRSEVSKKRKIKNKNRKKEENKSGLEASVKMKVSIRRPLKVTIGVIIIFLNGLNHVTKSKEINGFKLKSLGMTRSLISKIFNSTKSSKENQLSGEIRIMESAPMVIKKLRSLQERPLTDNQKKKIHELSIFINESLYESKKSYMEKMNESRERKKKENYE